MKTVEDCIEILAGMQKHDYKFSIDKSDINLITSLARQTFKGIGYTDRQHSLALQKIDYYKSQFTDIDISEALTTTRIPIRSIDRSRWVKIVDHQGPNKIYRSDDSPFIAVRFIFQKKLINNIESIKKYLGEGEYDKENKIHYFPFSEQAVYHILSNFNENNNFEVQFELKEYYEKLEYMKNNKDKFIPGIYGLKIKNLSQNGFDYAISTIGEPTIDNLSHYYDQKERIGIDHFDKEDLAKSLKSLTTLSKKIVSRTKSQVLVNNKEYTKENLAETILELYRFPLLIVLNESNCYDELVEYHKAFNGIILNESCSVMFRLDNNDDGIEFNQYIQSHQLNNQVDESTKIVYISNNKVPKPLLKSNWSPSCVITNFSGKTYGSGKVDSYMTEFDLVIHYDDQLSPWYRKNIEKI